MAIFALSGGTFAGMVRRTGAWLAGGTLFYGDVEPGAIGSSRDDLVAERRADELGLALVAGEHLALTEPDNHLGGASMSCGARGSASGGRGGVTAWASRRR
jgi:hypothetical protein